MSHFVSRGGAQFDTLNKQLLRREPLDSDPPDSPTDGPSNSPIEPTTPLPHSSEDAQGPSRESEMGQGEISAALASRRRRDLDEGAGAHSEDASRPSSIRSRTASSGSVQGSSNPRTVSPPDYFRHRSSSHTSSLHHKGDGGREHERLPPGGGRAQQGGKGKGVSFSDARAGPGEHPALGTAPSRTVSPSPDDEQESGLRQRRKNSGDEQDDVLAFAQGPGGNGGSGRRTKAPGMITSQEAPRKLGTWDGVFMPVTLNILGIILFLRFGFILGQAGLLGSIMLLTVSYAIDTLTAMSVSAISTNGQVRGGGAYYLISRSLGPEFGGSIGIIFYAGQALNAGMNVLGFVESLTDAFGESRDVNGFLPEGPWWSFTYGSVVLLICTLVCLVGSKLFARATLALAVILGAAIISIPISSLVVLPFTDSTRGVFYTGWSIGTLRENLLTHFTSGAAGSAPGTGRENWQTVFGVLFPAVTGILAGASMSGDLRKPSKSIPKGTNGAMAFTYAIYVLCFLIFAGTIRRESFYSDLGIVSDVALSPQLITFGALASTAFSALMGVLACAKVLQAIARDNLLPALAAFAQGTEKSDDPTYATLLTWILIQGVLFVDSVNVLAQLTTMATLLTFGIINLACFVHKAGGSPNFRPSFRYFSIWSSGGGVISCFGAMYFTDAFAATACLVLAIFLFIVIHYSSPPKSWGDFSRNLHYHIVRKYLLRLDERKGHVKYWRPQILLLANNPRTEWNLLIFCNSLKKGALYVLGHVLKGDFEECLPELRKQQIAWLKLVDVSGIKSFVDVVIARDEREGARQLILSCGLGGMRPNVVVMGFPSELQHPARASIRCPRPSASASHKSDESEITIKGVVDEAPKKHRVIDVNSLPTDSARRETPIRPTTYVGIMEDTLALNKALAIGYGFDMMQLPGPSSVARYSKTSEEKFIDLWPIQIASPDEDATHAWDTYTMVLQLGTILSLTGTWKSHKLRVSVFVEHEAEVEEERRRVRSLLENLRIPASLRVFNLSSGSIRSYQAIVLGKQPTEEWIEKALRGDPWWEALKQLRKDDERRAKAAKRRSQHVPVSRGTNAHQSKREQQIMGVSLPAEHLAFFKRNMRIGLAHPRAKVHADSESDADESSSDDSDIEDELAMLSDDDWDFGHGRSYSSGGPRIRRRSTVAYTPASQMDRKGRARAYSIGGSAGLPDEPGRPLLASNADLMSPKTEYGTMRSSQTAPSLVLHRATAIKPGQSSRSASRTGSISDSGSTAIATATAEVGSTISEASSRRSSIASVASEESDQDGTLKASERTKVQARLLRQNTDEDLSRTPTASTFAPAPSNGDTSRPGSTYDLERGPPDVPSASTSRPTSMHGRSRSEEGAITGDAQPRRRHVSGGKPVVPAKVLEQPLISFNELPNRAQYLILNELIRINSSPATSVVLTALPAPERGTANNEQRSLRYLEQLESLFGGGPPVLGVHAKTLTVTMSL